MSTALSMAALTDALHGHALRAGADLLAIAPIERFAELTPAKHPASIFPEARSVLVVGKRITRGTLRGVEEGTQFDLYRLYGRDWLTNRVLATTTYRIAEFLEDAGWEAVPLPNLPSETPPMGIPAREGQPAPNVLLDCDDAAVRAGMGEIGDCGLLLTPRFGPRQRIQLILTDADLIPDPPFSGSVCLHCADLEAVCPLKAISTAGPVDAAICHRCKNGVESNHFHASGKPDRSAALCTRTCMVRLETAGRLSNIFENSFRTREPWGFVEELKRL